VRVVLWVLYWLVRLLRVGHKANCCLVAMLQVILGPSVHCAAVCEAQGLEDADCCSIRGYRGALYVLNTCQAAAVVADGCLEGGGLEGWVVAVKGGNARRQEVRVEVKVVLVGTSTPQGHQHHITQ
jgi:hypothetical protein